MNIYLRSQSSTKKKVSSLKVFWKPLYFLADFDPWPYLLIPDLTKGFDEIVDTYQGFSISFFKSSASEKFQICILPVIHEIPLYVYQCTFSQSVSQKLEKKISLLFFKKIAIIFRLSEFFIFSSKMYSITTCEKLKFGQNCHFEIETQWITFG